MRSVSLVIGVVIAGLVLHPRVVLGQARVSGGHVHYRDQSGPSASPTGALAPRLQNLGSHTFPVSTRNRQAQTFMNQGLNLAYAFNHAEARRAFREAARLDPDLAMAYWGQALVLGPNINALMEPNEEPQAFELIQKALSLKQRATVRERAYIDALAQRYSGKAADRLPRDAAYADAMRKVHQRFPNDLDAAMLYVESVMDLRPWGYWQRDGAPHVRTDDIVALTEQVMARHPKHPGAVHMYIHLMEGTSTPEKAEKAADTLQTLMPAAGHMVHMPGHIYQRIGRYADAIKSNQLAIAADEDYISQCRAQGLYPMAYYPHNIHFLWFSATEDGQSRLAIEAARQLATKIDDETLQSLPLTAGFRMVPYYALTRFGRWDDMLKEPEPPAFSAVLRAMWHYARGLSFVATDRLNDAEQELQKLTALTGDPSMNEPMFSPNQSRAVVAPAPEVLAAEIAAARGRFDEAITRLDRAVRLEDSLVYTEPSEFHFPPRLALGAILLKAGRPAEAETVYWEHLRRHRENGWGLFGLLQALRAQNKTADAELTEARFKAAWARADVTLTASRFGK
jgi:tetratricopeptide (TPR) repeat protein